jgi:hypothetical protein
MIGLLILNGIGAVAETENKNKIIEIQEIIHFSEPIIDEKENNILVNVENTNSWLRKNNCPMIPAYTKTYILPFKSSIHKVDVYFSNEKKYSVDKNILTSPKPITTVYGKQISQNPEEINTFDVRYPEKRSTYQIRAGIYNNTQVFFLTIQCYPIQYDAADQSLYSCNIAEIFITYESPKSPYTCADEYDMVIIAPEIFSNILQPLIDHKNEYLIHTLLKTTEEIYDEFTGFDKAEQVKYFIKYAKETYGTDYVLLVGGMKGQRNDWYVPVRYSHLDDDSDFETSFLSDLYYADIYDGEGNFSSWDPNGNGIFAEWNQEEKEIIDLMPDIYLGRLPCRNIFEVKIMVNKIIEYENTANDQEWFNKMVVVGGDSAPGYEYYEGEEENKKALEYMSDFQGLKLWTSDGSFSGVSDVVQAINGGCGFLFFDGHGNPSTWSTHPPDDAETWITGLSLKDMPKLKNKNQQPVTVVGGCHNGQFDVTLMKLLQGIKEEGLDFFKLTYYYKEWVPECWAWRIARKIDGGGIAIMAYTGLDWFAEGDYDDDGIPDCVQYFSGFANTNFFKNYGMNNLTILGETHTQTLIDYIIRFPPMDEKLDCKTVQEFALLGDPSLQIGGYP